MNIAFQSLIDGYSLLQALTSQTDISISYPGKISSSGDECLCVRNFSQRWYATAKAQLGSAACG